MCEIHKGRRRQVAKESGGRARFNLVPSNMRRFYGRRKTLAFAMEQYFIAPDNGILSCFLAAEIDVEIRELTNKQYFLGSIGF